MGNLSNKNFSHVAEGQNHPVDLVYLFYNDGNDLSKVALLVISSMSSSKNDYGPQFSKTKKTKHKFMVICYRLLIRFAPVPGLQ